MIRIITALLITIAALAQSTEDGNIITGNVTHQKSHTPLTGVKVLAVGADTSYNALTDRYGNFNIQTKPGTYKVVFTYFDLTDTIISDVSTESGPVKLDVAIIPDIRPHWAGKTKIKKDASDSTSGKVTSMDKESEGDETSGAPGIGSGYVMKESKSREIEGKGYGLIGSVLPPPSSHAERKRTVVEDVARSEEPPPLEKIGFPLGTGTTDGRAGVLTSGEINDFRKWDLWQDITKEELMSHRGIWPFNPEGRFTVQLVTKDGMPAIDKKVQLVSAQGQVIWESRTDNTGKAELWANIFEGDNYYKKGLSAFVIAGDGKDRVLPDIKEFHDGVNFSAIDEYCSMPKNVDIAFVVDATGSMVDEIDYLKAELKDIIGKIKEKHSGLNINLGSVFYRDITDAYIVRKCDFTDSINKVSGFINDQYANGGGDYPEAVDMALQTAINEMQWSDNAVSRLLFLILDAPPHQTEEVKDKLKELSAKASMMGIRIIPVTCSGIDKTTEYLMRSLALATNGTYVFLTDNSGVGDSHIEPTTDKYDVELLNDLFIRLIGQFTITPECGSDMPLASADSVKSEIFGKDETEIDKENAGFADLVKCYPNPTAGDLNIEIANGLEDMFLVDVAGKIVERVGDVSSGRRFLSLAGYPTGIYFLKYSKEGKWASTKVMLMR